MSFWFVEKNVIYFCSSVPTKEQNPFTESKLMLIKTINLVAPSFCLSKFHYVPSPWLQGLVCQHWLISICSGGRQVARKVLYLQLFLFYPPLPPPAHRRHWPQGYNQEWLFAYMLDYHFLNERASTSTLCNITKNPWGLDFLNFHVCTAEFGQECRRWSIEMRTDHIWSRYAYSCWWKSIRMEVRRPWNGLYSFLGFNCQSGKIMITFLWNGVVDDLFYCQDFLFTLISPLT